MAGSILNIIHPTYYADTINGSVNPLSGLLDPNGQPVPVGVACYVANGDGAGNPVVWTCAVSTASVDHSTVEAVAGATGCRWLKAGAFGGGGGGGGGLPAGTLVSVGSDSTNVDLTVNSTTDGGWEFWGLLVMNTSDADVYIQPAANTGALAVGGSISVPANQSSLVNWTLGSGPPDLTKLFVTRAGGNANRLNVFFNGSLKYHDGVGGWYSLNSIATNASFALAGGPNYNMLAWWAGTDSSFTTLRFAGGSANAIRAGSWIRYRKLGFTV